MDFQSQILSKPFLWQSQSHIFGVEIEVFTRIGDIEIQQDIAIDGYSKAASYNYRAVYASLGYASGNKRFFLPKQELTSIGNILKSPDDLEINLLNCWMRDGQSVRFKAYQETEEMRSLRQAMIGFKQWMAVTDLYQFDSVAKTATAEIMQDVPVGKYKIVLPAGLTGSMTINTSASSGGAVVTNSTNVNLAQQVTTVTFPVGENWTGKITFGMTVTTGNFPESFQIYTQDK
jgi:hypothetical protein